MMNLLMLCLLLNNHVQSEKESAQDNNSAREPVKEYEPCELQQTRHLSFHQPCHPQHPSREQVRQIFTLIGQMLRWNTHLGSGGPRRKTVVGVLCDVLVGLLRSCVGKLRGLIRDVLRSLWRTNLQRINENYVVPHEEFNDGHITYVHGVLSSLHLRF